MLWDCAYCGTRKLLGKSQRFCPKCGAPQDPERRYFPPAGEEIAVEDHVYVGADRVCPACDAAMSARAAHCTQCGSPLEGAKEVRRIAAGGAAERSPRASVAAKPAPSRRLRRLALAGVLALLAVGLLVVSLWKKDAQARVAGVSWRRSIVVETLAPKRDSAWCDSVPRDAYGISRRREVRSQRQVKDGEDCKTVNVDRGDGTFSQRRECTPRYRDEPVYDERCEYTVERWGESRKATASGDGHTPPPYWPQLGLRAGDCRGCDREGARRAWYEVALVAGDKRFVCETGESEWLAFKPGSSWAVKLGVVTGSPDCGSLKPASGG